MDYLSEANKLFSYTKNLRRQFHQVPELGFQELQTSMIITQELEKIGLDYRSNVGGTGIIVTINGINSGPHVLLRFDMDALPIVEKNDVSYKSKNLGMMHACGHDAHMAVGLSIAKLLNKVQNQLPGKVTVIFQPAEEGLGGAKRMLAENIFDNGIPDYALAMHVWNSKPIGWFGITPGPMMARSDNFLARLKGHGGHAAMPDQVRDPIIAASQIVTAIQSIVSRNVSPLESAVISVTKIEGGNSFNIIPSEVIIQGTIRTFDNKVFKILKHRFEKLVHTISEAMECQADIELINITLAVENESYIANLIQKNTRELFPNVEIETNYRTMGSEDMSFFFQDTPGCFVLIGSGKQNRTSFPHHNPNFDIEESCLSYGVALLTKSTIDLLHDNSQSA